MRPIHWSYRPKAYINRTLAWDDYPNGRWGDSRSPAFGFGYPLVSEKHLSTSQREASVAMWGTPVSEEDVQAVFLRCINQEIGNLPWFEDKLLPEFDLIKDLLVYLNTHQMLTLPSQPQMNGFPSNHP